MSFFTDHIQRILDTYEGHPPLALFLRRYFKSYPKLGSRDRKALSEAAYIFYRCRRFFPAEMKHETVIALGFRLCGSRNAFLEKMLQPIAIPGDIKPQYTDAASWRFSEGLDPATWLHSMWQQPELFIRLRKQEAACKALLQQQDITWEAMRFEGSATDALRIANGKAIDTLLPPEDYVVQDWSSQRSVYILRQHLAKDPATVWDVCSGAGGKSILLKDILPPFDLTVSDIREAILHNLRQRFKQYGLGRVTSVEADSSDAGALAGKLAGRTFDLVLCDVPCSGSGTWARTPEQFHFFRPAHLQRFTDIQFPIARNAARYVKPGGLLAYITCSVFEAENEAVVKRLQEESGLQLKHQQLINGIEDKADCMFVALFEKQTT